MFPVLVTLPDGRQLATCRIWTRPGAVSVLWWDGTEIVEVAKGTGLVAEGKRAWTLATDAGHVHIVKEGNCGCGHVLRRWRPPTESKPRRVGT